MHLCREWGMDIASASVNSKLRCERTPGQKHSPRSRFSQNLGNHTSVVFHRMKWVSHGEREGGENVTTDVNVIPSSQIQCTADSTAEGVYEEGAKVGNPRVEK